MKYFPLLLLTLLLFGCKSDERRMIDNIRELEANKSLATSDTLINSYVNFAKKYPKHEHAVKMLFKAAKASSRSNDPDKALELYKRVANEYSDTCCSPYALMAVGMNLQVRGDIDGAKQAYAQFMKQYPNHQMRNSAELYYQELGLSEDEKMRRFWERVERVQRQDSLREELEKAK